MIDNFDRAYNLLLPIEGGYVNDPQDPGGETKYGISKRQFPHVDIKNLTIDGAKAIYKKHYWDEFSCNQYSWPLAFTMFDCYVNHAPGNPTRWLQMALGLNVDGRLGPVTIKAAKDCRKPLEAATKVLEERVEYRITLLTYRRFGKGWRRRDLKVMREATRGWPGL